MLLSRVQGCGCAFALVDQACELHANVVTASTLTSVVLVDQR